MAVGWGGLVGTIGLAASSGSALWVRAAAIVVAFLVGGFLSGVRTLDHYPDRLIRYADINARIASANEAALREADLVIAALEGVEVDSGTAAEIGFAYALGTPIIGFRIDRRRAGENEACLVNLQVRWFIDRSGGTVVRTLDALIAEVAAAAAKQ